MKPLTLAAGILLALLLAIPAPPILALGAPCTVDALQDDIRTSLVGNIEVSTLRINWRTSNEGPDFFGYEVWSRVDGIGERLAMIAPLRNCPLRADRDVRVPYDANKRYWLELKLRDGTIRALPITVR